MPWVRLKICDNCDWINPYLLFLGCSVEDCESAAIDILTMLNLLLDNQDVVPWHINMKLVIIYSKYYSSVDLFHWIGSAS